MINASIKNLAVDMLLDLLKIYSPSREEKKAIEVLKNYCEELGYQNVEIDNVGNLIASYGDGNTTLAVVGHIDTIPWEIPVKFNGYVISGRGAVDAKGPLVAAFLGLSLAKNSIDSKKFKVYAIAAVDEEGDSLGAKHLVKSGFKADGIIIAEPSNGTGIVVGYRGSIKIKVVCTGAGGHSSSGSKDSACEKLISLWQNIRDLYLGTSIESNTATLLKLSCGEDTPVIPRYGEALVGIRVAIDSRFNNIEKDLNDIIEKVNECRWHLLDYTKPVKISVNNPVSRALIRTIIKNGMKPRILYKYGTSDMNILYPDATQNIAAYGPGQSELAHSSKEEITIDELIQGVNTFKHVVKEFFTVVSNKH